MKKTGADAEKPLALTKEILWDTYNNPSGSFWSFGIPPTDLDRARWEARKELAEELLSILDREAFLTAMRKN